MLHPVIERAPLQRVVDVTRPVRGQDDDRPGRRADRSELGNRHRVLRQKLQQEGLELIVGSIDLVDQEHRPGLVGTRGERPEKWTADEKALTVDLVFDLPDGRPAAALTCSEVEELAGVVPLVQRLGDVDSLVALQSDELTAGDEREGPCEFGLSSTRLTLQEERPRHPHREEGDRRQTLVSEVVLLEQRRLQRDRRRQARHPSRFARIAQKPALASARAVSTRARCRRYSLEAF
jgi:hypothetical protein